MSPKMNPIDLLEVKAGAVVVLVKASLLSRLRHLAVRAPTSVMILDLLTTPLPLPPS